MVQIAIANYDLLRLLRKIPFLQNRFIAKIYALNQIKDPKYYNDFLSGIKLNNSIYKTTEPARFEDVNSVLLRIISPSEKHYVHDIAVSNGVVSIELFQALKARNIDFQFAVSDKFSKGYYTGRFLQTVYESDMKPRNFYCIGICLSANSTTAIEQKLYRIMVKRENRIRKKKIKEFSFYHADVLKMLGNGTIHEIKYDVLDSSIENKFTFVRAMNILNRNYFSEDQIVQALLCIKKSMKNNAVFQIGRTHPDGVNRVSFFRKMQDTLSLIEDYNDGSEIKDLIQRLN